jgi:hypothetical protein
MPPPTGVKNVKYMGRREKGKKEKREGEKGE